MPRFDYTVTVEAATRKQADQVMTERFEYEEEYGFDYDLRGWKLTKITSGPDGHGE